MLLSSDKLVIMKIVTCALVTIFIITRLSDDNITLPILNNNDNALSLLLFSNAQGLVRNDVKPIFFCFFDAISLPKK